MEKLGRWEQVSELFDAALKRDPADRDRFLSGVCGQDAALREEIESLLSAHARSDPLSTPAVAIEIAPEPRPLETIGPYRLIRKIGEGGMGQVWLAEQTEPLSRQVALKLIRSEAFDDALLRRFRSERQSLALMDHPAIAKVFDAGATAGGQPYFVMEYVSGESITAYCDHKKLSIRERLELFLKVCEGVQHAHQKAIIHRDLKPANILVVEVDGKPAPRLIDFGLAKVVVPWAAGESASTAAWGIAGTPGYISPEQAAGGDIDTRTDVYSLGVILYQLLTGSLPFDTEKSGKQPLDESLRQLREEDPPSPSARLGTDKKLAALAAPLRAIESRHLASLLHGDLDCISLKALERDRARRYGTPSELAADITRYLNHEPVEARPASARYRLLKYARRHRMAVGVAASLVILLTGFAIVEAVQLRRITEERDRSARERDRANRIADFMTGMFKVPDPSEARGNQVTAREILDRASTQIETGLAKDPEMQAQLMYVMGKTYQGLGLYRESEAIFRDTLEIQQRALGPNSREAAKTLNDLGTSLMFDGAYAEAEKAHRQALEILQRTAGPQSVDTAKALNNLASALVREGHFTEAGDLYRQSLDIQEKLLGPRDPAILSPMSNLGVVEFDLGNYAEAERLDRETIALRRQISGPDHPETLKTMNNLATLFDHEGRLAEAEQLDREVLDARRRVLGPDHPDTLRSMFNLARIMTLEGQLQEAEKLDRTLLGARQRTLGPENVATLETVLTLAGILAEEDKSAEAERMEHQALDSLRRTVGFDNPETISGAISLAAVQEQEGRYHEAEVAARAELEEARRVLGPDNADTRIAMNTIALALAHQDRYAEAEDMAKQAFDMESKLRATQNLKFVFSTYYLACIAAIRGQRNEAFALLEKSIEEGLWPEAAFAMAHDSELTSLRSDPRFGALASNARQMAAENHGPAPQQRASR